MISIYYGTRPEYIKVKLLYEKIRDCCLPVELVKVNQHTTLIQDCFFDREVSIGSSFLNRLNQVVSSTLSDEMMHPDCKIVMVQGDTATAFGVALNAFHNRIPIAHIEAGLRTYDNENPYPEESYRRCISAIAKYHFCVTNHNYSNLLCEGISEDNLFVVGNTSLDNLHGICSEYGDCVLVTLHRRENQEQIAEWFSELEQAAETHKDLKFVLPLHPTLANSPHVKILKRVSVISPLKHSDLISLLANCRFVITDSGGIQEEASFLNKKVIVCRKETERLEGIKVFIFMCPNPSLLQNMIHTISNDYHVNAPCPYGDGTATDKIALIMKGIWNETIQTRT
jgi:UDP-N-acetylglucosamine 2-epimerase (non-hydrolysing)